MYQIKCDGYILHDARVDDFKVISPKCSLEVNKTGSLTFQIAPDHPYYDKVQKHTSEITLYQDNDIIFQGRVLNDEANFYNIKNVECEGELSYFIDSIQRGKVYQLSGTSDDENVIELYLEDLVSIHNSQVDDRKKFVVGTVNIADPNNYLYKISNYEDTLTILGDKLIGTYGGQLIVRHENGVRYLDYVDELTNTCNQTIEFGKNIVDMKKYVKGENIYTALIPLGATLETTSSEETLDVTPETYERRLKISSLADSTDGTIEKVGDYIYDTEAVEQWGWVWKVVKWDDVTIASNLLSNAKNSLKNSIIENLSLEMTAVDLHLLDVDIDRIRVGDIIGCLSVPHNLNTILSVKSMTIDIDNPSNTIINLTLPEYINYSQTSITNSNKDNDKNISDVKNEIIENFVTTDEFKNDIDSVKDWVSNNFGDSDLSSYAKIVDVNSAFSQLASALQEV